MKLCYLLRLLLVLLTGWNVQPSFGLQNENAHIAPVDGFDKRQGIIVGTCGSSTVFNGGAIFYEHNEARVAKAMAEAEANRAGVRARESFPDWEAPADGCRVQTVTTDLGVYAGRTWYTATDWNNLMKIRFMAVDSCAYEESFSFGLQGFEIGTEAWRKPTPGIELQGPRTVKVLAVIYALGMDIVGEGVYVPATGTMHLVGCSRTEKRQVVDQYPYEAARNSKYGNLSEFEAEFLTVRIHSGVIEIVTGTGSCAIAVTVQYPPVSARWNWQREAKLSIRSMRDPAGDDLYFQPVEMSVYHPYGWKSHRPSSVSAWDSPSRILWRTVLIMGFGALEQMLLGNRRGDYEWRSRFFRAGAGITTLLSLYQLVTIAKHFQLLPILPFYDPYVDTFCGVYENPTPWYQMAVVSTIALWALAVHFQVLPSFRSWRPRSSLAQSDDVP